MKKPVKFALLLLVTIFVTGCHSMVPTLPQPTELALPTAIEDNTGTYLCPYTSDGTVCAWVEKGKSASMGASVGSAVGAYAGAKALEQVPFVGSFLGSKLGNEIGRRATIAASGGMDKMKEQSDLSFNSINDLIVYVYVKHSLHPDYADVVELTGKIYPDFSENMYRALSTAKRKPMTVPTNEAVSFPTTRTAMTPVHRESAETRIVAPVRENVEEKEVVGASIQSTQSDIEVVEIETPSAESEVKDEKAVQEVDQKMSEEK